MFKVQILGNSSATPAFSRFPSSQLVNFNERFFLIDCGEGTQIQLQRYRIRLNRLNAIFISHLHGDHILGLPGLLSTMSILERPSPLTIYAPAALKKILDVFFEHSETVIRYPWEVIPLEDFEPGTPFLTTEKLEVLSFPLHHRTFCRGFLFREINKRKKFDFFKAKSLAIPNDYFGMLKQGKDVELNDGTRIHADDFLLPADPPLSYAYCSDTAYDESIIPFIQGADLLYHESTFTEAFRQRADDTLHSTAKDAATIALKAGVKKLIIGHFSARYRDLSPLLEEAQAVFPETELALEGYPFDLRPRNV